MIIGPHIKTIIWDLDGTLIDSFDVFWGILAEVLPKHKRPAPTREVLAANYHGSMEDTLNNSLGRGLAPKELETIISDILLVQSGHYEVIDHYIFQDALQLARHAGKAGIRQILVTNRNHEGRLNASPRSIIERSELKGLITNIISGDDSEHRKPKPEVVSTLLQSGELLPSETLVIGDQFVDAEFAKNLKAQAILVCRNGGQIPHLERLGAGWQKYMTIVESLNEVSVVDASLVDK